MAAAGCRSCRQAQLTFRTTPSVAPFAAAPATSSVSNEQFFGSVEIAEVVKILEKLCLFFENINEA
jgi:hypothetical protein